MCCQDHHVGRQNAGLMGEAGALQGEEHRQSGGGWGDGV